MNKMSQVVRCPFCRQPIEKAFPLVKCPKCNANFESVSADHERWFTPARFDWTSVAIRLVGFGLALILITIVAFVVFFFYVTSIPDPALSK